MAPNNNQRAGFQKLNVTPAAAAPKKPAKPSNWRRNLVLGAMALGGWLLVRDFDWSTPKYRHSEPNRDVPNDVFKETAPRAAAPSKARIKAAPAPEPALESPKIAHAERRAFKPETPAPATAPVPVTTAERAASAKTMLLEFYLAQGGRTSEEDQNYSITALNQTLNSVDVRQPVYEKTGIPHSPQRTHMALSAIREDGTSYAFICTQEKSRLTGFAHAAAKPDGQGSFIVKLSDTVLHEGYLKGLNLMESYGKMRSCTAALHKLNDELNGSAELAALRVSVQHTSPYQFKWH